jgi:MoaA/NifB/PqqE/SkfB family radical SAM enzyme
MKQIAKLHLHVTNQCTHYCRHCSSEAGPHGKRYLTTRDFQYILDWARDAGAKWVELSGGEPLTLGEDLFQLIEYAHENDLYTSLLSNGSLIDLPTAHTLRDAGIGRVGVSIYGANSNTHDDFTRTPGSFSKTVRGMQHLTQASIETIANVVVTPKNLAELHQLPSLLDGIAGYAFGAVVPAGRGRTLPGYTFSEEGSARAIRAIESAFSGISHYFMLSLYPASSENMTRYCMRPFDEVTVNHEGQVIPCCVFPEDLLCRVGNAKERNFDEIVLDAPVFYWLKKGHQRMREALQGSPAKHNLCTSCIAMLRSLTAS